MSKLLKSLLAATAVLSLAPTTASARPPPCEEQCYPDTPCSSICLNITNTVITCGSYGVCEGLRTEATQEAASVIQDEAQQSQEESRVCSEDSRPVSVEG